jgi:hypothetical protein
MQLAEVPVENERYLLVKLPREVARQVTLDACSIGLVAARRYFT